MFFFCFFLNGDKRRLFPRFENRSQAVAVARVMDMMRHELMATFATATASWRHWSSSLFDLSLILFKWMRRLPKKGIGALCDWTGAQHKRWFERKPPLAWATAKVSLSLSLSLDGDSFFFFFFFTFLGSFSLFIFRLFVYIVLRHLLNEPIDYLLNINLCFIV